MTQTILSPYRICPLGAHVDHQGGVVLGRTIQSGTTLEYSPLDSDEVVITSEQLGEKRFRIGEEVIVTDWIRYAQAAARVLPDLKRGMQAYVRGPLIGAGLSSSASVGLAYLKALADVNDIELADQDLVHLDVKLENGQLGLQNGILDPLTIVHGKKNALLFMDTVTASVTPIPDPPGLEPAWIVAYSGISRELTKSGYNVRVEECRQAASLLEDGAERLSEISHEEFEERKDRLPAHLCRRAEHFFGEIKRVHSGARAWQEANWELFGALMNQSCESSIKNYESGSDILIELHQLVSNIGGIYGSRFSGGGYGGCVVALAQRDKAESAREAIAEEFSMRHPELRPRVFIAEMGDGISSIITEEDFEEKI